MLTQNISWFAPPPQSNVRASVGRRGFRQRLARSSLSASASSLTLAMLAPWVRTKVRALEPLRQAGGGASTSAMPPPATAIIATHSDAVTIAGSTAAELSAGFAVSQQRTSNSAFTAELLKRIQPMVGCTKDSDRPIYPMVLRITTATTMAATGERAKTYPLRLVAN